MTLESINDDVFHEICKAILETTCQKEQGKIVTGHESIKSLSATNSDMRKRLEPIVFRSISIDGESWYITLEALKFLARCQPVHNHTKCFHLSIRDAAPGSLESVDGLPEQFATILSKAKKLQTISIDVPNSEILSYRLAAQELNVTVPTVKTLELTPQMEWMVDICPHVTTIRTCKYWPRVGVSPSEHTWDLIYVASLVKSLQSFEMEEYWTTELVEEVHNAMPDLKSLALLGRNQNFKLQDLLPPLSKFTNLKTLSIPIASELGIGFCPPIHGRRAWPPEEEEVARHVGHRQAEERASRMIFAACPRLEVVWIGRTKKTSPKQDEHPSFRIA